MQDPARFQISPRLASLLAEGYRSSEQAIKELVDNSWDADAENVWITLPAPLTLDPILISDDGSGMTAQEVLNEYLLVAAGRRTSKGERTSRKNRLVKGKKGIGKFAGLLAAEEMSVETKARSMITQLTINKRDILSAQNDLQFVNLPYITAACDKDEHGTTVCLSHLNQNLQFPNADRLKQLLILEYGRKNDFKIFVNGDQLDIDDIPGETFSEEIKLEQAGTVRLRFTIAEGKKKLAQSGIVVRVKGKIVGRPSYFGLEKDDLIPAKLLTRIYGEVEADSLADVVTANWGAIIENSKAYQELKVWTREAIKTKTEKVFTKEINLAKARLQKEINKRLENFSLPDTFQFVAHGSGPPKLVNEV
jgi:hypothetical protein